eukprot:scaffold18748_cov64-Phaeocystis_antarctica.AAC.1
MLALLLKRSPFDLNDCNTFEESLREVPSRSPFEKSLLKVPSSSPFGNVPSVRSARARLARSARATAPRAAVRGGRPRSLRVRPRAADWRTRERDFAKPHLHPVVHFTYINTQFCNLRNTSCCRIGSLLGEETQYTTRRTRMSQG